MEELKEVQFETVSTKDVLSSLETDSEKGLTSEEAKIRLEKFGPNKLEEQKKKSWIRIFFEQMANPMIYVLFGAVAITTGVSIYETIKHGSFDFLERTIKNDRLKKELECDNYNYIYKILVTYFYF